MEDYWRSHINKNWHLTISKDLRTLRITQWDRSSSTNLMYTFFMRGTFRKILTMISWSVSRTWEPKISITRELETTLSMSLSCTFLLMISIDKIKIVIMMLKVSMNSRRKISLNMMSIWKKLRTYLRRYNSMRGDGLLCQQNTSKRSILMCLSNQILEKDYKKSLIISFCKIIGNPCKQVGYKS